MRRVGILGGTFDPVHAGHLDAAAACQRALHLDAVLVIPSNIPPHRPQPVASSYHRFAMVALAVAGRTGWRASDVELLSPARSYTSTTLRRLHADGFAPTEIFFITGADAFAEIATWKDYPTLFDDAHFAIVSRAGQAATDLVRRLPSLAPRMTSDAGAASTPARTMIFLIDAPTLDVSSTAIRARRGRGETIAGLVPPAVERHIEQHGLYGSASVTTNGRGPADAHADAHAAGRLHGED